MCQTLSFPDWGEKCGARTTPCAYADVMPEGGEHASPSGGLAHVVSASPLFYEQVFGGLGVVSVLVESCGEGGI